MSLPVEAGFKYIRIEIVKSLIPYCFCNDKDEVVCCDPVVLSNNKVSLMDIYIKDIIP